MMRSRLPYREDLPAGEPATSEIMTGLLAIFAILCMFGAVVALVFGLV